jgi:hypothetical protein
MSWKQHLQMKTLVSLGLDCRPARIFLRVKGSDRDMVSWTRDKCGLSKPWLIFCVMVECDCVPSGLA